jgi:nucleoside-diphosphate-sugar epimerase
MAILLTGGSGFIGSHFHNALADEELINLDLVPPFFSHHANYIKGDIRIKSDIEKAVKGQRVKSIISLAAKHHDFGIGHDEYFDTNEEGTRILCAVASENGIREIVFFSSVAVYGNVDVVTTEMTPTVPESPYGASKLAAEKVLIEWAAEDATRRVLIIRPALVFGPHNRANMFNLIRQIESGYYFNIGRADHIKSIAYVENVVAATLFLQRTLATGVSIYNYADEPQLTVRQIGATIASALKKKIRFTLPLSIGLLFGLPFDLLIWITGKNLPISTARIRKLATATHHSAQKIFATNFVPQFTTENGLIKMVQWFRSQQT